MLQFEHIFEKRLGGAIGAKVVDDTENFVIPVAEPAEGKAVITNLYNPPSFTPNIPFYVGLGLKNAGGDDTMSVDVVNRDTGELIKEYTHYLEAGGTMRINLRVVLSQKTDFRGLFKAGHIE